MKNETKKKHVSSVMSLILGVMFAVYVLAPISGVWASAQRYSDDGLIGNSNIMPFGEGSSVNDSQTIYYDYKEISALIEHGSAPSVGNTDPSMSDVCAPVSGTNIALFYDRWYTNIIPDFNPGMMNGNSYSYFPDVGFAPVEATIRNMYNAMGTNVGGGGTTFAGFQNGLTSYITNAGYSVNYSSFYSNNKTVNLNILGNAISNNKVGAVFLSSYNFIYSISHSEDGKSTHLAKRNANLGHIMMVYGYETIKYFRNGSNFQTDTYLYVSSAYSDGSLGFIKLNEFLSIDNALIISVV